MASLPVFLLLLASSSGWGSHTLSNQQQSVLAAWLSNHPSYRQATDRDCECTNQIETLRQGWPDDGWPPVPDYHPYQVVGDFNGDGVLDFAVVLVEPARSPDPSVLVVFNGPSRKGNVSPAFLENALELKYEGLFFGPPRPKPYRLIVGPFESDNTGLLLPSGRTYKWDDSDREE
jgi:hypothetical protein